MPRPHLCDYSDEYIVIKGWISITDTNNAYGRIKSELSRITLNLGQTNQKLITFMNGSEDLYIAMLV